MTPTLSLGGYVLAGGRSSRMGQNKALLELAGKPLIQHAVTKLGRTCPVVHILSADPRLAAFAPLVHDLHPGCGPVGGMQAALAHSAFDWNLFLPVDMPFLPSTFVSAWVQDCLSEEETGARIRMCTVDGRSQPGFCLLHKDVLPFLGEALQRGELKLLTVLQQAARELALCRKLPPATGLCNLPVSVLWSTGDPQTAAQSLWFANLNTPQDFALANLHLDALDP